MAGFSVNSPKARKSDQELVAGVLEDKKQFAAIVQRYEEPLFRYIVRQGARDRELARDILQEVFIKVYLHLNDYDASLPFSSWIYRIAHNETITHFRKEKNRPLVLDKGDDDEFFGKIVDDLELSRADGQYDVSDIQTVLERLEPRYRDILVLKFFEDKSYEEISDILQMPQGTVATLINRAKKKVKASLEKN
ncbi:MAG TPA: RNA polymerase sigma factor [Chlorobaculum sp.]|jgi:RNA polymerase sigma-70 factor (ECF subfamily)|uniref:RNA polymerase sigma-70 factor, ECF subfamily n=1 Tax=Chlorobaculum tepidum (strain ATCC 49652 / DSM 12025 / NBRC 103806 / TLS) TaxID=194439 RepID=Q8KF30_CHLTE|nr:RNA polymerase sigma factor [Chlorobaculum tepidum]AAM71744.1 RNA polymerase sigma-70 factor, ECF subfamily [Chlorobaculum tepidum TLS]HBU23495.1 RNA polymerase sigma factor [Chlorobaculum sp.]